MCTTFEKQLVEPSLLISRGSSIKPSIRTGTAELLSFKWLSSDKICHDLANICSFALLNCWVEL